MWFTQICGLKTAWAGPILCKFEAFNTLSATSSYIQSALQKQANGEWLASRAPRLDAAASRRTADVLGEEAAGLLQCARALLLPGGDADAREELAAGIKRSVAAVVQHVRVWQQRCKAPADPTERVSTQDMFATAFEF